MNVATSPATRRLNSIAVAVGLALSADGAALLVGVSPISVSLLGAATTVMGWWAFTSEP